MALEYEEAKQDYLNVLSQINLCLTLVFIGECVLKLIAFGVHVFFLDPWNQFDFFVVVSSLVDIGMEQIGAN